MVSATAKFVGPPSSVLSRGPFLQASINAGLHALTEKWCSVGGVGALALMASSYVKLSGCVEEAVALCRVKAANNALKNPYAHLREALTVEQVLNSPMLTSPIRQLHMCPITEGSAALILASEEVAERICENPVWVKDMVTIHSAQHWALKILKIRNGSQCKPLHCDPYVQDETRYSYCALLGAGPSVNLRKGRR